MRRPTDAAEEAKLSQIARQAFGFNADRWEALIGYFGRQNLRVSCHDGEVVGGLGFYPLHQWFGGAKVSMAGIAMVAVAPEHRGRGLAFELLRETMHDLRASGFAIATLYPSTHAFYRKLGFELSGSAYRHQHLTAGIVGLRQKVRMQRIEPGSFELFDQLDQQRNQQQNGLVARSNAFWRRLTRVEPGGAEVFAYRLGDPDQPCGYLIYERLPHSGTHAADKVLRVRDMVALTSDAWETIAAFVHGHRSVVKRFEWLGPALDPLLLMISDDHATATIPQQWMLRVLDVRQALLQRGYPCISDDVSLRIEDALILENNATITLRLEQGVPCVQNSQAGGSEIRLSMRGFATLFSGYYSAEQLSWLGLLSGEPESIAAASRIFAGTEPWMADKF